MPFAIFAGDCLSIGESANGNGLAVEFRDGRGPIVHLRR
jgi:hypothetical protein